MVANTVRSTVSAWMLFLGCGLVFLLSLGFLVVLAGTQCQSASVPDFRTAVAGLGYLFAGAIVLLSGGLALDPTR